MSKMTRLAGLAAALLIAAGIAVVSPMVQAQAQPPAAPAPAAPAAPVAATPTQAAAAPAASAVRATEIVDNPYGMAALWQGGDYVSKITIAILVIMSMGSWYIIITKVYEQVQDGPGRTRRGAKFWSARFGAPGYRRPEEEAAPSVSSRRPGSKPPASTSGCSAISR
jgi:biopolymer transport protein ExbB